MKMGNIGERIRSLRGPESRPNFASRFGISVATLVRYEHGETSPNADFIMKLCENYGVTPDWLIYGNSAKETENAEVQRTSVAGVTDESKKDIDISKLISNLSSIHTSLSFSEFDQLWNEYRLSSDAHRGWVQIEIMKRFPEFTEWLKKQSEVASAIPPSALKKAAQSRRYELPAQAEDD
jgi:transcriptional regulator with XRE-family HTH domain